MDFHFIYLNNKMEIHLQPVSSIPLKSPDVNPLLQRVAEEEAIVPRCDVTWKDLSYKIDVVSKDKETNKKTITTRTILNSINGYAKAGECLAIMGSSGAGKTSLLNLLSGKIKNGTGRSVHGTINYNGKSLSPNEISDTIGFVMQADIFLSFMTPEETFKFAADLRYDKSEEEKRKVVDKIIKDMKLEKARNTIVGSQMVKGISGGEKKRVNIGFELISDPQVLFLDEPTSGLDSYTSYLIIT